MLRRCESSERFRSIDDVDALIAAERQQVFAIPGDDEVGFGRERASKHVIIVGIVEHHAWHGVGVTHCSSAR